MPDIVVSAAVHSLMQSANEAEIKTAAGLGNVDNTSDANKPVSTAQATAIALKQNTLVSGSNIKTVNGGSIVGSGDLVVSGGGVALGHDDLLQLRTDNTNIFPDPFFSDSTLELSYLNGLSPFTLSGGWTSLSALAGRTYPAGKVLLRPVGNVSVPYLRLHLDKLGLVEGDVFRIVAEARFTEAAVSATSGYYLAGVFYTRNGTEIGDLVDIVVPTGGNPLTDTRKTFTSADITVPVGAGSFRLGGYAWGTGEWALESFQIIRGVGADRPVQNFIPANLANRLSVVEAANMQSLDNGLLLRRTSYSALEVVNDLGGISTQSPYGGYGQSYLAAACPFDGFNAIRDLWKWELGAYLPSRIYVAVTTCPTGSDPLNQGKFLASGYVDVDPQSGSAGVLPIQLFAPDGTPKTILPADLDDLMGIYCSSVSDNGIGAALLYVSRATGNADVDPALPVYRIQTGITNGIGDAWSSAGSAHSWGPDLVMLTDPVTTPDVASLKLANSIGLKIAEPPSLIAFPKKMWCIVGLPTWVQYATIQTRDHRQTAFTSDSTGSISKNFSNGFRHIPSAAGDVDINLRGEANGIVSPEKTCTFSAIAAATGAGTARFLMLGDSLTMNGSMQSRLNALAVGDVTSVVNMGTVGADPVKNEGYSGQPNGVFFSPGNPFYNAAVEDFDFDYYMTNLAVADPTHVLLASGFWHAAYATDDSAAVLEAETLISQLERMITSIHTYNSAINVGIWTQPVTPYDGQDGESQQITPVSNARRRRNAILFGQAMIEQFSEREGDNVYSVATGQTMNPDTGFARTDFIPIDPAIEEQVAATPYANYAALAADLAPGDGALAAVTNGSDLRYYVKVWGTGVGHWRVATAEDGFIKRVTDSIHPGAAYVTMGDLVWAWIKATL